MADNTIKPSTNPEDFLNYFSGASKNVKSGPVQNQGGIATTVVTPTAADQLAVQSRPFGVAQSEVRLVGEKDIVIFRATPDVEENGTALYISLDNIYGPSSFLFWIGSPARTFSINAKLISRTVDEANENYKFLNILKSWRMPQNAAGATGQTPETLRLWGYDLDAGAGHFLGIPCVLVSINHTFNSDTDYIQTSEGIPMPIILSLSLQLKEAHTIADMEKFSYDDYKLGRLPEWT